MDLVAVRESDASIIFGKVQVGRSYGEGGPRRAAPDGVCPDGAAGRADRPSGAAMGVWSAARSTRRPAPPGPLPRTPTLKWSQGPREGPQPGCRW
ncbi:hypothetical protein [Methanoculleus sp.]|uniref:hypothetical protein n=1 Tax=Methanoculleus sp. TaxID=90427 RepID=UPI0025E857F8|nr:hypothetical protein [Methanoculleus sp.]